jgi:SAM-dependent methyltransferase
MASLSDWLHANRFVRKLGYSLSWKLGESIRATPRRRFFLSDFPTGSVCAEIGVFRGEWTRHILEVTRPRELHLVDAWWELYGDHFPDWGSYTEFGQLRTRQAYDDAQRVIAETAPSSAKVVTHVGDDCAILESFPDAYFDWVYLDTSHTYDDTLKELEVLSRKVKPTGFISGDDWLDDDDPQAEWNGGSGVAIYDFCLANNWIVDRRDNFNQWRISRRAASSWPVADAESDSTASTPGS